VAAPGRRKGPIQTGQLARDDAPAPLEFDPHLTGAGELVIWDADQAAAGVGEVVLKDLQPSVRDGEIVRTRLDRRTIIDAVNGVEGVRMAAEAERQNTVIIGHAGGGERAGGHLGERIDFDNERPSPKAVLEPGRLGKSSEARVGGLFSGFGGGRRRRSGPRGRGPRSEVRVRTKKNNGKGERQHGGL
jgi:hypothetical protein